MTQNQGQQLLNDMDTVIARLNTLITGVNNINTNLNTLEGLVDTVDSDLVSLASMLDSWLLMIYDYRYPILAMLFFIFTILAIRGTRDN